MQTIITISREFGSGGREIGRRLAEKLNFAYYDNEIVSEVAKRTRFSEEYIKNVGESRPVPLMPITTARTFSLQLYPLVEQNHELFTEQSNIIKEMAAKSNCVIVGRCADYILREQNPFRLFVYADMDFKLKRCKEKGEVSKNLKDEKLKQNIIAVDRKRAKYYNYYSGQKWGKKSNYDLCVNSSSIGIEEIVNLVAKIK